MGCELGMPVIAASFDSIVWLHLFATAQRHTLGTPLPGTESLKQHAVQGAMWRRWTPGTGPPGTLCWRHSAAPRPEGEAK